MRKPDKKPETETFRSRLSLRSQSQNFFPQTRMRLGQSQIPHLIRARLRANDLDHALLLLRRPATEVGNQSQHQRPVPERLPLRRIPPRQTDAQRKADFSNRRAPHPRAVSPELARHPAIHAQPKMTSRERIPSSCERCSRERCSSRCSSREGLSWEGHDFQSCRQGDSFNRGFSR
jgi:hypothetical protein